LQTPLLLNRFESGGGHSPPGSSSLPNPAIQQNQHSRDIYRKNDMNPLIQLKRRTPVFLIALTWFELSPAAQALLPSPPPDGGYPSLNTAEGENALFKLTAGMLNTARVTVRSLEIRPTSQTQSADPTRPPVLKHSFSTTQAQRTRPMVLKRSVITRLPFSTRQWVIRRSLAKTSPHAATSSARKSASGS